MAFAYNQPGYQDPETGLWQSIDPSITEFLLKREDFETGTFAEKPWIVHQAGNYNYSAIVTDVDGNKAIRHMMNSNRRPDVDPTYVDPITGNPSNGLNTHRFITTDFHNSTDNPHIVFHQWHRFDDSWWNTVDGNAHPLITGKLFMQDSTVGQLAWYFGLRNDGSLTVVSSNGGASGTTWAQVGDGGWCSRSYGWENENGTKRNDFTLTTPSPLFSSDGIERKLTFELQYNPGGIGYHLGRVSVDDVVCHSNNGVNTDVDGWFNLPIEFEFEGTRFINAALDIKSPEDFTTDPGDYTGYVGGLEVSKYELWEVVV